MPVVHCKKAKFDVYIGRPSPWGNPFQIGEHGSRAEVIERYRAYLWERIKKEGAPLIKKLAALDGKVLGCWCSPAPCHGDVIARAASWAATQI